MKKFAALVIGFATFAAASPFATAGKEDPIEITLAIKIDAGATIQAVADDLDATIDRALIADRDIWSVTVERSADTDDPAKVSKAVEEAIKEVSKDKRVRWAVDADESAARDDRFHAWPATEQRPVSRADLENQPAFADLELEQVHRLSTGSGAIVAVLDTGVQRSHPLLRGRVIDGYDFVNGDDHAGEYADGRDNDNNGAVDEAHGHGTFVAGVVVQIAPGALVMPVRVLDADGQGRLYAVIDGIDYAVEHGADVINMSFGIGERGRSKTLDEAVKRARQAGAIVVAASGNDADAQKHYPASTKGVVSVTALDSSNRVVAEWATRGKWVTVAAPGFDMVSSTAGGGYARWAGTSMAAPVVSGGYALIIEQRPDDKSSKIESVLLKSTRQMLLKGSAKGSLDLLDALG